MGLGYLARQSENGSAPTLSVLKEMGAAIDRADAVVGDILEFAKPKELDLSATDVEPLIRQALRFVRHVVSAAKVAAVANFAGQLPPCALDRNKIKQVLVNLFTKCCHAMLKGGQLIVTTRAWRVPDAAAGARFEAGRSRRRGGNRRCRHRHSAGAALEDFDPYFTAKPAGKGTASD